MKTVPAALPAAEKLEPEQIKKLYENSEIDLVCVLGPTASGKTRYAVELARKIGAEIISADSRQVYRGMDIGTGKDLEEYGEVPYHLIDILPAGEQYNVHDFQRDFHKAYEDIVSRRRIPLLCGGTGLYISAVTKGYKWDGEKIPLSSATLPVNPDKAETEESGTSPKAESLKCFYIGTLVSREERNRKIDKRLEDRLQEGMIEEIQGLLDSGVSAERLISYGLEYKFITEYLLGERSREEMQERLAIASHQFAKRQMTWFRGMERSGVKIHWVNPL